ncbi:unnamed protein product [Tilletia controversa]|uniref:Ion transport domain-containing protein n=3 Tax=Tilletia TaxID=13289 RepID=A0A8X7SUR8_9BASI|nr:hypothetical protein CF336_g6502 [Tilletia laevis]KAE8198823.1 hypothetical protein CF328_g3432 [Tilletia controversa]KAE8253564.1 hypothetical protein A4X03_0g5862 [Tilletia caries]KAE8192244.1 hypothetical protein CF335_g5884 [Tilletia laevis]KAE8242366.1 hypothetical protein A4X06_0g6968 [Tilletia controversa]
MASARISNQHQNASTSGSSTSSASASASASSASLLAAHSHQQHRFRASPTGGMSGAQPPSPSSSQLPQGAGGGYAGLQLNGSGNGNGNGNGPSRPPPDRSDIVGRGTVLDPYGLDFNGAAAGGGLPMPATAGTQSGWGASFARPARSHYFLSRSEIVKGVANRFVHSTAYLYFYGGMAVASLLTVAISLIQDCPGTLFYSLELAINVLLIAEVGIRLFAFGKQFWKSTFNIIDLCLVVFCALTLLVIFFSHDCSPNHGGDGGGDYGSSFDGDQDRDARRGGRGGRSEELLDSILLIIRNAMQCFRLVSVVRRSRQNVNSRVTNIDLASAQAGRGAADADLYPGFESAASGGGMHDGDNPYGDTGIGGGDGGGGGGLGRGAGGPLGALGRAARFSLDIDLQDEGALARERMADGGDPAERKRRAERERWRTSSGGAGVGGGFLAGMYKDGAEEQRALFDADDDDDEEL